MRELAKTLTAETQDELAKATALRDYLRQNYRYTLKPASPPSGQSALDFFLFDSREGFCQHYAQALVVLARLAGLHARLALGFAPGNYDVLNNCYEVYEYHAHAWAQIHIPRYGWLTFDGTPPAALQMENFPRLLAQSQDAFDETWKPQVPELAMRPPADARVVHPYLPQEEPLPQKEDKSLAGMVNQMLNPKPGDKPPPTPRQIVKAARHSAATSIQETWLKARQSIRAFFRQLWDAIRGRLRTLRSTCLLYALLLPIALAAAEFARRRLARRLHRWLLRRRCRRLRLRAQDAALSQAQRIGACADILALLTREIGHRRLAREDAVEFSARLPAQHQALSDDAAAIADALLVSRFAAAIPDAAADTAAAAAARLCDALFPAS